MSLLLVTESPVEQGSAEERIWGLDAAGQLAEGETISGTPVVTLVEWPALVAYVAGIPSAATVDGTVISVMVKLLVAPKTYRLMATYVTSLSQKNSLGLLLKVPS